MCPVQCEESMDLDKDNCKFSTEPGIICATSLHCEVHFRCKCDLSANWILDLCLRCFLHLEKADDDPSARMEAAATAERGEERVRTYG